MRRPLLVLAALSIAASGVRGADQAPVVVTPAALSAALSRTLDPVIDALWAGFSRRTAMRHVQFVNQYWRLSGNVGYDASMNRVHTRLVESGFKERTTPGVASQETTPGVVPPRTSSTWFETYPNTGKGWNYSVGTLGIVHAGQPDDIVLSRAGQRVALCINSFSTAASGVTAPLVDVGRGDRDEDYVGKDFKGAVVLGDADVAQLWRRAVTMHGAIGVVSTSLGQYVNPNPPGAPATPRDQWNILQWGSIPYDEARKGFGFKATPHAAATLRAAIKARRGESVQVHVTVASTFSTRPNRMLVAEIPGRVAPDERIVIAAHVQEPGANDNASGVATLAEMARAMRVAISVGTIPQPDRTITFLWLEEISGSRQWLKDHPTEAKNVRYMFSMDMTGEDVRKTGGSFLIERWPDPGAVWDRPWDPHTEWGRGNVRENQLKGDLLNDLHLAVCEEVARKSNWVVHTNPYEGGSDHTVFGTAGVPAVLDWHFTDRYYHTNLDTVDKTSGSEMRNVGVSVAASAWLLASAREATALAVADVVAKAGQARVTLETREGAKLAAAEADPAAAGIRQTTIVDAWRKWYAEAVRSASRLIVGPVSSTFESKLEALAGTFAKTESPYRLVPASLQTPQPVGLTLEQLVLAGDTALGDVPPELRKAADQVVKVALTADSPILRSAAVRALGREEASGTGPGSSMINDADPRVRRETANAFAQSTQSHAQETRNVLETRLAIERDDDVVGAILQAIGRLPYTDIQAPQVQAMLAARATGAPARVLGAALGLESLIRAHPRTIDTAARDRLRQLTRASAASTETQLRIQRLAMLALQSAKDDDVDTIAAAIGSADWQVRRIAVLMLKAGVDAFRPLVMRTVKDSVFQVRLEALTAAVRVLPAADSCAALVAALDDPEPHVVIRAAGLFPATCPDPAAAVKRLVSLAERLGPSTPPNGWQVPAAALSKLARLSPADATRLNKVAMAHSAWQVRATAARAAGVLQDEATAVALARDREPNVRTDALQALSQMKSAALTAAAIDALSSDDHQLVRQAALLLARTTARDQAVPALLKSLEHLTTVGKDTSRDPRLALIQRLQELLTADSASRLAPYLSDFDPKVAQAAADAIAKVTGGERPVAAPRLRPLAQPGLDELKALPARATIQMSGGGTIELELLTGDAPVTIARFVKLARAGYYNGLTFHRVVQNFVIQGGSPGANEYVGDARYLRDELGLQSHVRGAVGISTRGRHSGDAQLFVDLVDVPRLDHDYTVFARVTAGMDVVDHVLEGATITNIQIKNP